VNPGPFKASSLLADPQNVVFPGFAVTGEPPFVCFFMQQKNTLKYFVQDHFGAVRDRFLNG
jgi:hypothetical protein